MKSNETVDLFPVSVGSYVIAVHEDFRLDKIK